MSAAITVQNVSKKFRTYYHQKPNTIAELVVKGPNLLRAEDQFWALRDVSFEIGRGRMLGVIGKNGAGKSTLLRLIGGVGRPDKGGVQVNGRIGALLDLGAGFHPDLTGRENVFIGGVVSGLLRDEIHNRFDAIVAFAELEDFIDNPLRTFSTGMQMRLAFAVAAHIDPDILLIDEVLAVGDMAFQRKCLERIAQFRADGCTILLVSHDINHVQSLCDEVFWLRKGEVVAHGNPKVVAGQYVADIVDETQRRTPSSSLTSHTASGVELQINKNRFGSLDVEIMDVRLVTAKGFVPGQIEAGEGLTVEIDYSAPKAVAKPIFSVDIKREGRAVCQVNSKSYGLHLPQIRGTGQVAIRFDRLDLANGLYHIDVGVYEQDWAYAYDFHMGVYPLEVVSGSQGTGVLQPPHQWVILS